jgi:transposase
MLIYRSILMLDNARIHWNEDLIQMCDAIKVILARLFSYSSDFNLIEIFFALLKAWIKKNEKLTRLYTIEYERFEQFLRNAVKEQNIKLKNSKNLFKKIEIQYFTINLNA